MNDIAIGFTRTLRINLPWALLLASLCVPATTHSAPAGNKTSSSDGRQLSVTVYNRNLGVVRDVRHVSMGKGTVQFSFADVASKIQPETVSIRAPGGGMRVLEQNYRYDLITHGTLLDKNVGHAIRVYRFNEKQGTEQRIEAKLLSAGNGKPIYEINGEVTYDVDGRVAFLGLPANLVPKPTLTWLVDSQAVEQRVEVNYMTQGLNWQADYVLVLDAKEKAGDLTGWVTLNNQSGANYENATLRLVAGDVNRASYGYQNASASRVVTISEVSASSSFREENLFEYHLYQLDRTTTLLDKEQKQLQLMAARGVVLNKKMIFSGAPNLYRSNLANQLPIAKVGVFVDFVNNAVSHLGVPLPKGTVRVYKADSSGTLQFVGEDSIDHTPKDEKLRVKLGEAFDVVGERRQLSYNAIDRCSGQSDWQVIIRNHKQEMVAVQVVEFADGDYTIFKSSQAHRADDLRHFSFDLRVPANGQSTIAYTVRVKWCSL
jgi:hypothetical protein